MSKLNLRLSYKDACILKHALRDKIDETIVFLDGPCVSEVKKEELEKIKKEHEEEKRALSAMTKAMINATECHGRSWYKPKKK